MRRIALRIGIVTIVTAAASLGSVAPARAAHVACGQVITQSTTLDSDVGPCPNNGIVIGADNITLDLNGHRVFGTPNTGDGAGILLQNRQGVTVRRGTVSDFDGGVVILAGSRNTVAQIAAHNNIGASEGHPPATSTLYGDGILVQASSFNTIVANDVNNNGPFSGIGLIRGDTDHPAIPPGPVTDNLVQGNTVRNNIACRRGPFCDNDGIRVEPQVGPNNRILSNTVTGNGLDGIALFGFTSGNLVQGNTASGNGFHGAVRGDGIRIFGFGNTIQYNTATNNAAGGVSVARRTGLQGSFPATNPNGRNNVLIRNSAGGNGVFDLWDSNPDCDNNRWSGNTGRRVSPPCTLNP